ncbi:hypothetical protein CR513_17487, partial [Mucuna pruriens]
MAKVQGKANDGKIDNHPRVNMLNQERSKERRCFRLPTESGTSVRFGQCDKDKKRTNWRRFEEIRYLASTACTVLRFRFRLHLGISEFIVYFIQDILCIKHSIFDSNKPCFHTWISELLLFCIINQNIDGQQLDVQLVQQNLIQFSTSKEVQNLRRR